MTKLEELKAASDTAYVAASAYNAYARVAASDAADAAYDAAYDAYAAAYNAYAAELNKPKEQTND
jgi:hypothetical protein